MKTINKILINIALFIMNTFRVLGLAIATSFKFLAIPLRAIVKFIYHLLILPAYRFYLLLTKRAGLSKASRQRLTTLLLLNKRFIHIIIIGLILMTIYNNLTSANKDVSAEEVVGKTILSRLVRDEFVTTNELVEETRTGSGIIRRAYLDPRVVLNPRASIFTKLQPEEEDYQDGETEVAQGEAKPAELAIPSRTAPLDYTVLTGDTLSTIARKFGISVNTILWENNLNSRSYIRPGDKLTILPVTGVSHKVARGESLGSIASKYDVDKGEIATANKISGDTIRIGQVIVIPDAKPLSTIASASSVASRTTAGKTDVIGKITSPKNNAKPVYGTKMNWPTVGYRITQYYSWRHNGLDIANKIGTPIYAVDSGTVETVGYNRGGYGNQIVINHGGGKKTRYAHLNAFAVKVGQQVERGQYIAEMGSTGRSTGPHIHFEVMINGVRYNPLNYIQY